MIYFDHNAATFVLSEVSDALENGFSRAFPDSENNGHQKLPLSSTPAYNS